MKLRTHYDWIVLGDHPGALLSAGLVAKLGFSVLILPMEEPRAAALGSSRHGSLIEPETNFILGLRSPEDSGKEIGLTLRCLLHLGLSPEERATCIQIEGNLPQVLTPRARVALQVARDAERIEFEREFGKGLEPVEQLLNELSTLEEGYQAYWRKVPERLTLENPGVSRSRGGKPVQSRAPLSKRALRAQVRSRRRFSRPSVFARNEALFEALEGFWFGNLGHFPSVDQANYVQMLALGKTGASWKGGLSAYRSTLCKLAQKWGADQPEEGACASIFVERGRFVGVQVSRQGNLILGRSAILGCSFQEARSKLNAGAETWMRQLRPPLQPAGWKFTIAVTVNVEAIPPGTASRLVWKEKGSPPLEIELIDPSERRMEHRLLMLRTVMPMEKEALTAGAQRLMAARMFRQLSEIFPFVEYHVRKIYPDFRHDSRNFIDRVSGKGGATAEEAESELSKLYSFRELSEIPERLLCYDAPGKGVHTGIENLFSAASEAAPELGSLGSTVCAVESVAWLAHRSGFAGPLL